MNLYPLKFQPIYKEKIWGGRKLESVYGRELPPGRLIGESWEIADHGEDVSRVSGGPLNGVSLKELMAERPADFLGERIAGRAPDRFPLLVKLIDASDKLSVQVHPTDDYAARHEGGEWGKTEMWFVAHADDGAELICGLAGGVGSEEFERAMREGDMGDCLNRIPVKEGDVMFVPSGRVHAIGAGNLILEIQENSDVTYRVYDWDRVGNDGKPRQLHKEKAMEVIDFRDISGSLVKKEWKKGNGFRMAPLTDCRYFRAVQYEISGEWHSACTGDRFRIISFMGGGGNLYYGKGGDFVELRPGDNILLPANLGEYRVRAGDAGCTLLQTEVP